MATKQKSSQDNKNSNILKLLVFIFIFIAVLLINLEYLRKVFNNEVSELLDLSTSTEYWIIENSISQIKQLQVFTINKMIGLKSHGFDYLQWLSNRLYVVFFWVSLIILRVHETLLWLLIIAPLILASGIDGYYVREISKEEFKSQSPIRHQFGMRITNIVWKIIIIICFLPIYIPLYVLPLLMSLFGCSLWIWVSNLQKRI